MFLGNLLIISTMAVSWSKLWANSMSGKVPLQKRRVSLPRKCWNLTDLLYQSMANWKDDQSIKTVLSQDLWVNERVPDEWQGCGSAEAVHCCWAAAHEKNSSKTSAEMCKYIYFSRVCLYYLIWFLWFDPKCCFRLSLVLQKIGVE